MNVQEQTGNHPDASENPRLRDENLPPADEDGEVRAPVDRRKPRGKRGPLVLIAAITAVAAAGTAATGAFSDDADPASTATAKNATTTTPVERTTLTGTETVDGSLGFGEAEKVRDASGGGSGSSGSKSAGSGAGVITWLPDDGDVLERGDTVYSVDEKETPLLYGSTPLYRELTVGSEGNDVEMLERNLDALGYSGITVDEEFTSGTAAAVQEWQGDLNRSATGVVASGEAVVASGSRRVTEVTASTGGAGGEELLTWSGTERVVSVDLDTQYEDLVENGTRAQIELPDGKRVDAEVTDVGTPTSPGSQGSGESSGGGESDEGNDEATLPVELKIEDQKKLGRYQAAGVDVILQAEAKKDVLAVPVNALLAESGGGYSVETEKADGTSKYLPVKLGMFANGKVEVSGKGIKEGLEVVVPE
ncbi:peptidoglycan-binding protein [Streptomyces sp. NPDC054796]